MAKPALGKGLGALIGKSAGSVPAGNIAPFSPQPKPGEVVRNVAHGEIIPSTLQPRKEFAKEQLSELMESIRSVGIMQPLIVRARNGKLELIAGERRWRASGELGLKEIPVIVREASDKEVLEMALIENLQREGLNPIEEAHAYARLSKEFNLRQEDIAQRVGKNRATVANAIRLLDLPSSVQSRVREGKLSTGHAKVLLGLKNPADIEGAAAEIIAKAMTVRACEKLVDSILRPPQPKPKPSSPDAQLANALKEVQKRLTSHLATAVQLHHGEKKGRIEIEYYGVDDLNRLLGMMGLQEEDFGG